MELFSWEGEDISPDKDKSITRSIQHPGEKYETPNDGASVEGKRGYAVFFTLLFQQIIFVSAHIVGKCGGNTFLDKDFKFILGECSEVGLPDGIDKAIRKFKKHEKSAVHMKVRLI